MLQDWEQGLVGNNRGTISGLAKRETLAQVMVRAFRPIQARRETESLPRAA
ncbi:hypothetical protein A6F68_00441 [Tsuneonella dongtanensis]|uniref:Uncharacterized protein n=1 Tax=Tsuneonella dongtanensis TaxID=692370 RepID=A0A1B2AA06_9SPHN|nr:hypothetical protein A6F68_00441 [Tsuneonella dongtanensis]